MSGGRLRAGWPFRDGIAAESLRLRGMSLRPGYTCFAASALSAWDWVCILRNIWARERILFAERVRDICLPLRTLSDVYRFFTDQRALSSSRLGATIAVMVTGIEFGKLFDYNQLLRLLGGALKQC